MTYKAVIGFFDRYTGTDYETVEFEASSQVEAEAKASQKGNSLAYQYSPDYFFVEKVYPVTRTKKYRARIALFDRHMGTEYESVEFEASNKAEAMAMAERKADNLARQYHPDNYYVEDVYSVA